MEPDNEQMESMAEEFNEMKRINLFSLNDINKLIKKRSHFEQKINGANKYIQDYKAYIQHEKELLKDIRLKRDKLKTIDLRVVKRIQHIYDIASQRFPNDYPLCLSYFKFCKTLHNTNDANMALQNILKNYAHKPEVWKLAAKFHAHDKQDRNMAIRVLLRGLTIHKDNQDLYKEAIELELMDVTKGSTAGKTQDDISKDKQVNEKIKHYLESIFNDVKDFHFYIEIMQLLESYPATIEAQNMIVNRLMECYSGEGLVWHTIAQRELNGHYYTHTLNSEEHPTVKLNLEKCFNRYEEGLKRLTGEKRTPLWHYYLDCLIALQGDRKIGLQLETRALQSAFENAFKENILTEKYYILWIEMLSTMLDNCNVQSEKDRFEDEIVEVLEKGLKSIPQSVELWKLRLKVAIMTDEEDEVNIILKRGVQSLKEKAVSLWLMALRFHLLVSNNDTMDGIYQSAVQEPGEVANIIKPRYIQWLGSTFDIAVTRNKYNIMAQSTPYCKELHFAMDVVESNELSPNIDAWKKVHRNACNQFGRNNVDVWIAYAQFLSKYRPMEVANLCSEVKATLSPLFYPDFQERWEEHKKLSAGNPSEKIFEMLSNASRKRSWSDQDESSDFIPD